MKYVYKNSLSTFTGWTIPASCVEVDDETYEKLVSQEKVWKDGVIVDNPDYATIVAEKKKAEEEAEAQKVIDEKKAQMNSILVWLNEHDYIINKHLLGEYTDTDEKWTTYLTERKEKLAEYNKLEEEVNG